MPWQKTFLDDPRIDHLKQFYLLLDKLESKLGGPHKLSDCSEKMAWPRQGVYFFQESGECRSDTGTGQRIVRVGSSSSTDTSLWVRLSQHKGNSKSGGGSHRTSIFRNYVGAAVMKREGHTCPTWGQNPAPKEGRECEEPLEKAVTKLLGEMGCLWVAVENISGQDNPQRYIERNSIALLSNHNSKRKPLDQPSKEWLGLYSDRKSVKLSGLWVRNYVKESYDPSFLGALADLVEQM